MGARLGIALFAAALVAAGCDAGGQAGPGDLLGRSPAASPTSTETLVISLVATSSGEGAWKGDSAFRGADLAVQQLNRDRRENEAVIELVTLDDNGDPRQATELVASQAATGRTLGVVYAGPPEGLPPAEEALAQAGIPALLCFGDLYGARLLSEHVFQVSPSYIWEARRLVRYALEDRRYRTVGALTTDSFSGQVARRALTETLAEEGRRLAGAELVPEDGPLDPALEALRRRKVEAIVVEGSPAIAQAVIDRLGQLGHAYRGTPTARIASATKPRNARENAQAWRPQVVGFDGILSVLPEGQRWPAGTVAADTYARGAHYLPVPSFESFRKAYVNWWESEPLEWERRAYEAVMMIGWAAREGAKQGDLALTLESLRDERFGGSNVTFGPDDHTSVDETSVGLWVIPRRGAAPESGELPPEFPWVPLGRGFSIDGEDTDIHSDDWKFFFPGSPRPEGPAPKLKKALFGVTSPRSDPIH
jgi:ABC-type branched-subunit amino acid transport system substrate-binding protein